MECTAAAALSLLLLASRRTLESDLMLELIQRRLHKPHQLVQVKMRSQGPVEFLNLGACHQAIETLFNLTDLIRVDAPLAECLWELLSSNVRCQPLSAFIQTFLDVDPVLVVLKHSVAHLLRNGDGWRRCAIFVLNRLGLELTDLEHLLPQRHELVVVDLEVYQNLHQSTVDNIKHLLLITRRCQFAFTRPTMFLT
ncbi:hypothetical protein EDD21DRAFT_149996 [Dissophora ornata]|nr:hypothetical protein EDD21DRAFT_149996 [Dissophora ornata]